MSKIRNNIAQARDRVATAARAAGKAPSAVTIVAVTKTFGAQMVCNVVEEGLLDIGENRVQEFLSKVGSAPESCRWHLIGPLQRNKVSKVVGSVALIHTVDSLRLAQTIDRIALERGIVQPVLLQVNTSGEPQKSGFAEAELESSFGEIISLPGLHVQGLMTIGPTSRDADATRSCFTRLRAFRDELEQAGGASLPHLSMGMSGDFEMAIAEGATLVRLGRTITGDRPQYSG